MLDWSGGCGTRTIRCASTCSDSPRRNPLTSLRYSVVEQGNVSQQPKLKATKQTVWAQSAHTRISILVLNLHLTLNSHHPPPSSTDWSGDFGEDCLSTQCEFRSRLTSRAHVGNLEEVADLGRLFLGYFLLAKQKKVTSRRATPGK